VLLNAGQRHQQHITNTLLVVRYIALTPTFDMGGQLTPDLCGRGSATTDPQQRLYHRHHHYDIVI